MYVSPPQALPAQTSCRDRTGSLQLRFPERFQKLLALARISSLQEYLLHCFFFHKCG